MISLRHVSKQYKTLRGTISVLRDVNLDILYGDKVGILGRNGAGKSTMVRLISGAERPSKGSIARRMSVSWPIAFGGAFQTTLTGMDNIRFICRIYDRDEREATEFVQDFSELGRFINEPVRTYSQGMRARLAFALSIIVDFDCFLIDEIIAVGDARFHQKCNDELFDKRASKSKIIVSHNADFIRETCDRAAVLSDG
ncbi:MAG TPA: ABC transporter ATP-binding protein, partial [Sphingomicrobium sp.]|nr:ABC transporter ATP-binding protein [Sphingomicrobium sp.]